MQHRTHGIPKCITCCLFKCFIRLVVFPLVEEIDFEHVTIGVVMLSSCEIQPGFGALLPSCLLQSETINVRACAKAQRIVSRIVKEFCERFQGIDSLGTGSKQEPVLDTHPDSLCRPVAASDSNWERLEENRPTACCFTLVGCSFLLSYVQIMFLCSNVAIIQIAT